MIRRETIDKILDTARVEEVIGDFVSLKRSGSNLKGLSPFSQEKTPSFMVSPAKNIFKDFSSGIGGNSVTFLMEHEKMSFPEALRYLAAKYGIEIEEEPVGEEEAEAISERESLYVVLNFARDYFQKHLKESEEGQTIALTYLQERGISEDATASFHIGFSPSGWDTFTKDALAAGHKEDFLVRAGLSIKTEKGSLIDRFRNRVMFPILSVSGRTLGFGGRIMGSHKKEAKYINSPETEVYNKSEIIYGIYQAKRAIRKADRCYLVEGYTDVIGLHQQGIENVGAASGTSLTEGHLRLLKRYSENITFLFDGDAAGIKASLRAIDLALKEGLNVKAIALPEGEDPDSFARKSHRQDLAEYFDKEEKDFILFKSKLLLSNESDDPIEKAEHISSIVESISLIPEALKRSVYIKECSKIIGIGEEDLLAELNRMLAKKAKQEGQRRQRQEETDGPTAAVEEKESPAKVEKSRISMQEREILRLLFSYGDKAYADEESVAAHIVGWMNEMGVSPDDEELAEFYFEYVSQFEANGTVSQGHFFNHNNRSLQSLAADFGFKPFSISENWRKKIGRSIDEEEIFYKKHLTNSLERYKLELISELIKENAKRLKTAKEDELSEILNTEAKLHKMKVEQARRMGSVILY